MPTFTAKSMIIGVDVHKDSHTAVAIDVFANKFFTQTITNQEESMKAFLEKTMLHLQEQTQTYFVLEDAYGNGEILANYLDKEKANVYSLPSVLTERERRRSPHNDKTDELDAHRVAKIFLTEQEKAQPYLASIKKWIQLFEGREEYESQRILLKLQHLELIMRQVQIIEKELEKIGEESSDMQLLLSIPGCGVILAAELLGELKDIQRYNSAASLAKYGGFSPREHSAGGKVRHYTSRRGNRKLNCVLHRVALSHIGSNGSEESKAYYERKKQEGKSKLHALRCLKRRLIGVVYSVLKNEEPFQEKTLSDKEKKAA